MPLEPVLGRTFDRGNNVRESGTVGHQAVLLAIGTLGLTHCCPIAVSHKNQLVLLPFWRRIAGGAAQQGKEARRWKGLR
jgi:hypothetical protein